MTSRLLVDKLEGKTTANSIEMPSGSVIQVVHRSSADAFTNSSTGNNIAATTNTWVSGGVQSEVTITPKFSSSFILLQCVMNIDNAATDNRALYTFFKSVNNGTYSNLAILNSEGYDALCRSHDTGERGLFNQGMQFYDAVDSTQVHKYRVYVRGQNSGNAAKIRNDIVPLKLTAMEIAG